MLELLEQTLFADKLKEDTREPLATFEIPGLDGTFGLYPPVMGVWQQALLLVLIQMILQMIFAAAIYKLIVKQRGTLEAFLFGYAVVIPLALSIPFFLLEELKLQNKCVKLSLSTLPTIVFFRTLEAMYGTSSSIIVEVTMANYMTYYSSLMAFDWVPKTLGRRKITSEELLSALGDILVHFVGLSLIMSFMLHVNFQPFESNVDLAAYNLNWDLLSAGHLGNTLCLAYLTYFYLALSFDLTAFADQAKGFYTKPIFLNPMLRSRSIQEFWNRRWDLMIHRILKHGVYEPAKQYYPVPVAVALAYIFSGLLHDYSWMIAFHHHSKDDCATCADCEDCFNPVPMKLTAFFVWCGMCMLVEQAVSPYVGGFLKSWPTIIVSHLVILTALPVSHWYSGDWAMGGKFADLATGLFQIKKLP